METADAIVVGAGLAGLSCAHALATRGKRVLVLEARDVLGGRTASWKDSGMTVESGLHKFLGIYRELPALLEDCGVSLEKMLTWVDAMEIHIPDGPGALFRASPYHHPIRTFGDLLDNADFLPAGEKAALLAMGARGLRDCANDPEALDRMSIAEYARKHGVSDETVYRFIHTLTAGVLFLPADRFSAYAAFAPVLEGVKRGMTMGIGAFNGGMTEVMIAPIARAIHKRGGTIRTGAAVTGLLAENGRIAGVRTASGPVRSPHVVLAVTLGAAQSLLRDALPGHPWLAPMLSLRTLSAATIQCVLDRPLFDGDHTHFSPTALCCFAEQSHTTFPFVPGRLSAILYPPDDFLDKSPDETLGILTAEAARIGIDLRGRVTDYRTVHHPDDFYAMEPGSEALRPAQETPIPGLSLAGDYTKQPFLASMEGAVLSGKRAAEAALAAD